MKLHLNQDVMTTHGPATFIGYFEDGKSVQVCRKIKRNGQNIIVNPIIPLGDITGLINAEIHKGRRKHETQVAYDTSE